MRTFEEYILESRRNYIFGGTDNRNTDVSKTFSELEEGDKLYCCEIENGRVKTAKQLGIFEFERLNIKKDKYEDYFMIFCTPLNKKSHKVYYIEGKYLNFSVSIHHRHDSFYTIVSTRIQDLLEEIKYLVGNLQDVSFVKHVLCQKENKINDTI